MRILGTLTLFFCVIGSATATETRERADNGRQLFVKVGCYQCHGTVGQGGFAGPRLAPNPLSQGEFLSYVRNASGDMPAYSEQLLPPGQLGEIYAYLSSIPQPPAVKDIPLLNLK